MFPGVLLAAMRQRSLALPVSPVLHCSHLLHEGGCDKNKLMAELRWDSSAVSNNQVSVCLSSGMCPGFCAPYTSLAVIAVAGKTSGQRAGGSEVGRKPSTGAGLACVVLSHFSSWGPGSLDAFWS